MNTEQLLLTRLVDAYERSSHCLPGKQPTRRVQMTMNEKEFPEYDIRDADCLENIHRCVASLSERGWIEYTWRKRYDGLLLHKIYLITAALPDIYHTLGRNPKDETAARMDTLLKDYQSRFQTPWKQQFVAEERTRLQTTLTTSRLLHFDMEKVDAILKVLLFCEGESLAERVISVHCFRDSKYLERNLESALVSIAKRYEPEIYRYLQDDPDHKLTPNQVLNQIGIQKAPEIFEFCGNVGFSLHGQSVPVNLFERGFCIQSNQSLEIDNFDLSQIERILFVENRTNYRVLVNEGVPENTLLFHHGGFYSPTKGELIKKICASAPKGILYQFWGDIDMGGFSMYQRLKSCLIPELKSFRMDAATFRQYQHLGVHRELPYLNKVRTYLSDNKDGTFAEAAACILESGVIVEQESML